MYPTVAPFHSVQPHHRIQDPQLYDANDREPFLNSRSRIQLPHPIQRLDNRDATGSSSSSSANVEHTLRRKTPNGTLAAGYDGTPVDTNQPPPKHILVSPMEGQFLHPGMQDNWHMLDQTALKQMNFPPVFKNDGNAIPSEVDSPLALSSNCLF